MHRADVVMHPRYSDHPAMAHTYAVKRWSEDMRATGREVSLLPLENSITLVARPLETARTNANLERRPHRARQFGHSALPGGGPDGGPDNAA